MNREIKFRAWDESNKKYLTENCRIVIDLNGWIIDLKMDDGREDIHLQQYTGIRDKNGVEICEGDLVNVFFTSIEGEYIHDCVYKTEIQLFGPVFRFCGLLWESYGHNQIPYSQTLKPQFLNIDLRFNDKSKEIGLCIPHQWGENHISGRTWKQEDESFHFEVIGNIYENPELLEN